MANYLYYPSCNFTKASPEAAKRLREYLSQSMPVTGCCRVEKAPVDETTLGVYLCQACRETLEARTENRPATQNLFVYLDNLSDYPWPDYSSLTVNVQDCWRDREHPEIWEASRSVLRKMGVTIIELEKSREKSTYCPGLSPDPTLPVFTAPLAVTTCNRCTRGLEQAGVPGVHLAELVTGVYQPQ